ncbi:helix-turn-helix domain-containing protein [Bacillus marinisedimentorum]|uniref:helix-turn-helix domain-containing protein n=1 Tax=Bacillus marinisedimentorum TaxID=1821260 RepID=UPI0008725EA5|nr:helix-turn-helix domain-containing protein [Bacillus marinisedimentorum]
MKRDWLIKLRKHIGLTQEQVASKSFINRGFYAQIENGQRDPSVTVAKNIAAVLGFNPTMFFSDYFSEPFQFALEGSHVTVAYSDPDYRYTWVLNPFATLRVEDMLGKYPDELHITGSENLTAIMKEAAAAPAPVRQTVQLGFGEKMKSFDVYARCRLDENREVMGIVTIISELAESEVDSSDPPVDLQVN